MKKSVLLISVIPLLLSSCHLTFGYEKSVQSIEGASYYMPSLEELGNYKSMRLSTKKTIDLMSSSTQSIALFVKYAEVDALSKNIMLNEKYTFLRNPTDSLNQVNCTVKGYFFRVVGKMPNYTPDIDLNDDYYKYPKMMLTIGVTETSIAYLYHHNPKLEYIHDLEKFINKYYDI